MSHAAANTLLAAVLRLKDFNMANTRKASVRTKAAPPVKAADLAGGLASAPRNSASALATSGR